MSGPQGNNMQLACFEINHSGVEGTFNSFTAKTHATATIATAITIQGKRSIKIREQDRRGSRERTKSDEPRPPSESKSSEQSSRPGDNYMTSNDMHHYTHAQMRSGLRNKWAYVPTEEMPLATKLRVLAKERELCGNMAKKSEPYRPLGSMTPVLHLKLVKLQRARFAGSQLGNAEEYKRMVMKEKKHGIVLTQQGKGGLRANQKRIIAQKISSANESGKQGYDWFDEEQREEEEEEEDDDDSDQIPTFDLPIPRAQPNTSEYEAVKKAVKACSRRVQRVKGGHVLQFEMITPAQSTRFARDHVTKEDSVALVERATPLAGTFGGPGMSGTSPDGARRTTIMQQLQARKISMMRKSQVQSQGKDGKPGTRGTGRAGAGRRQRESRRATAQKSKDHSNNDDGADSDGGASGLSSPNNASTFRVGVPEGLKERLEALEHGCKGERRGTGRITLTMMQERIESQEADEQRRIREEKDAARRKSKRYAGMAPRRSFRKPRPPGEEERQKMKSTSSSNRSSSSSSSSSPTHNNYAGTPKVPTMPLSPKAASVKKATPANRMSMVRFVVEDEDEDEDDEEDESGKSKKGRNGKSKKNAGIRGKVVPVRENSTPHERWLARMHAGVTRSVGDAWNRSGGPLPTPNIHAPNAPGVSEGWRVKLRHDACEKSNAYMKVNVKRNGKVSGRFCRVLRSASPAVANNNAVAAASDLVGFCEEFREEQSGACNEMVSRLDEREFDRGRMFKRKFCSFELNGSNKARLRETLQAMARQAQAQVRIQMPQAPTATPGSKSPPPSMPRRLITPVPTSASADASASTREAGGEGDGSEEKQGVVEMRRLMRRRVEEERAAIALGAKQEEELRSAQMLDFAAIIDHDIAHMKTLAENEKRRDYDKHMNQNPWFEKVLSYVGTHIAPEGDVAMPIIRVCKILEQLIEDGHKLSVELFYFLIESSISIEEYHDHEDLQSMINFVREEVLKVTSKRHYEWLKAHEYDVSQALFTQVLREDKAREVEERRAKAKKAFQDVSRVALFHRQVTGSSLDSGGSMASKSSVMTGMTGASSGSGGSGGEESVIELQSEASSASAEEENAKGE